MIEIILNSVTVIALVFAFFALRENIITRKTSIKPLLSPGRIKEITSDDNLFAYNYEYPIAEEIGHQALVQFGIRNIGKGPANNVRIMSFISEDEVPCSFNVGPNIINIPEGESIPFIIRVARKEQYEFHFATYLTTIYYENLFGNKFYLSIRLWIQEDGVAVIEYYDKEKPKWRELDNVVWRDMESYGYYELRKIEEDHKNNKNRSEVEHE